MADLPKTIDSRSGSLTVGKRYDLHLWHGGPADGSDPVFPPVEVAKAKIVAFESDGEVRFEAQGKARNGVGELREATIGFLPDHVLEAKES